MDLSGHINDLITVATEMKNQQGTDKKAIGKTIARLEEAQLWSRQINPGKMNGVISQKSIDGINQCSCPEGAVDKTCLVHGDKS